AVAHAAPSAAVHAPAATTADHDPAPAPVTTAVTTAAPITTNTSQTIDAPAATASPAAPAPPPSDQMFVALRSLQHAADGSYRFRIELRPPELGRIDLRVELRDGVLHTVIHTEHAHTAALVRDALNDLRARLDQSGMRAGDLSVKDDSFGSNAEHDDGSDAQPSNANPSSTEMPTLGSVVDTTDPDAVLDVRI
ncbi:MAG TPA: flagellar hook-length control protein FliK, partial [Acidimicrobiia bacterium]|nr:flagellar hook-length control protein FliK [Acidimicrobiia bacterium]